MKASELDLHTNFFKLMKSSTSFKELNALSICVRLQEVGRRFWQTICMLMRRVDRKLMLMLTTELLQSICKRWQQLTE